MDRNLILFFSWGRRELIEKTFPKVLETMREQDRILVIDQGMHNFDFYAQYKDKIDFLYFTKLNYSIGPIWEFLRHFLDWKEGTKKTFFSKAGHGEKPEAWYPNFINIVESDALVSDGWIDKLTKVFELNRDITIVSGFSGTEFPTLKKIDEVHLKNGVSGVQIMVRANYYRYLLEEKLLHQMSQDCYFSELNKNKGKFSAVLPGIVEHIGGEKGKAKGFIK